MRGIKYSLIFIVTRIRFGITRITLEIVRYLGNDASKPEFSWVIVSSIRYAITSARGARSEIKRRMDSRWFLETLYSRRSND